MPADTFIRPSASQTALKAASALSSRPWTHEDFARKAYISRGKLADTNCRSEPACERCRSSPPNILATSQETSGRTPQTGLGLVVGETSNAVLVPSAIAVKHHCSPRALRARIAGVDTPIHEAEVYGTKYARCRGIDTLSQVIVLSAPQYYQSRTPEA